jgi:hypothetical protein
MRKIVTPSVVAFLAIAFAREAAATKPKVACPLRPAAAWISLLQITDKAKAMGYDVWKVGKKHGCWRIKGYDKNGASIKAYFDPGTGQLLSERDLLMSASQKP